MSKQSKISAFFLSPSEKRLNINQTTSPDMKRRKTTKEDSPVKGKENKPSTPKKFKSETGAGDPPGETSSQSTPPKKCNSETGAGDSPGESSSQTSPLSPEQRDKMDQNKIKAQMKLTEKNTHGLVQNIGETWFKALHKEFEKPYFTKLSKFVAAERKKNTIYPPPDQVFSFTNMSDFEKLKVVILGQDPYHGPNQAHGLCFSVQRGVPPPPSLVNMYKELEKDIDGFKHPGHGYLGGWAEQGVLLLNAVLTVKAHNANSHKGQGWEMFTDAIVSHVNQNLEGVVFILWGGYAQKKGKCINQKRHHVITGLHPSPLSAHRGFFGCKHFSKCNDYLIKAGKTPIDWTHLPLPDE